MVEKEVIRNEKFVFYEFFKAALDKKYSIIFIAIMFFLLAFSYIKIETPTYKTSIFLLPPLDQDIQELNQKNLDHKEYNVEIVFSRFLVNAESRKLRKTFFDEKSLVDIYRKHSDDFDENILFEQEFNQKILLVKQSKINPKPYIEISFELKNNNPNLSSYYLNDFIVFLVDKTRKEFLDEVNYEISNQVRLLNEQIVSKKELAAQRRLDRIIQLNESLLVAKKLNIEYAQISQSDNKLNMDYNRGWRAIEAELNVLKERESDEPFIDGIRNLQERIAYLNNLIINPDKVSVVRVDQHAEVPFEPIKPKSTLLIMLSVFFGLLIGFFVVLVQDAISKKSLSRNTIE